MPQYNVEVVITFEASAVIEAADEKEAIAIAEEREFADWDILDCTMEIESVSEESDREGSRPAIKR